MASLVKNWDMNFALGGPIKKDKLWFYGNLRSFGSYTVVPGFYGNMNAGNPNSWTYVAEDGSVQAARTTTTRRSAKSA